MKLYVCWDTRLSHPFFGGHPCGLAHMALVDAGYDPEVIRARGWTALPRFLNNSEARRDVRRMSGGSDEVPALLLDSGEFIQGSEEIIAWAEANPASSQEAAAATP